MSDIAKLPIGWMYARLDDVLATQADGRTLHQGWSPQCEAEPCRGLADWGVLKTTAIQAGQYQEEHHKRLPDSLVAKPAIEVSAGDLLITCAGPRSRCGIACLVRKTTRRLMLSGKIYRFRVPEGLVDGAYLEAFLLTDTAQDAIDALKTGGSDSGLNLTQDRFRELKIQVAPYREQTRIVTKLEELLSDLDAGVAELKAAQKKLAQYRQSLLKSAVEGRLTAEWRKHNRPAEAGADLLARILAERRARWEAKQLAKFNEQGKTPPKGWQASYPEPVTPDTAGLPSLPDGWVWSSLDQLLYELRSGSAETSGRVATGYPILKSSAVRQGEIDFTALNFLDSEQSRAENFLEIGDVLITRLSGSVEYVGCCAVVDSLPAIRVQFPDRIFRGKVFSGSLVGHYLAFCLRSHQSRQRLEAAAKSTAGHKRISLSDLHPFPIPLPPEAEGLKIVESLRHSFERIERMASEIELGLKQSTAQRKNILRAAFAGQLVPQDPNDEPASALLDRIRVARKESAKVPHRRKVKGRA